MMNELKHYGVLGMHWGVRRYQNADGSLTSKGRKKAQQLKLKSEHYVRNSKEFKKAYNKAEDRANEEISTRYHKMYVKRHGSRSANLDNFNYQTGYMDYFDKHLDSTISKYLENDYEKMLQNNKYNKKARKIAGKYYNELY